MQGSPASGSCVHTLIFWPEGREDIPPRFTDLLREETDIPDQSQLSCFFSYVQVGVWLEVTGELGRKGGFCVNGHVLFGNI